MLLLILTGYELVGLFFFSLFVGAGILLIFLDFNLEALQSFQSDPSSHSGGRTALLLVQGASTLGAFILAPWAFIRFNLGKRLRSFFNLTSINGFLLVLMITFSFMIVNSVVIEWNQHWDFPGFMSGFEDWARAQEDRLAELTTFLTQFDSPAQFALALLVIALLPGIGEELLFRGLVQNLFHKTTGNAHLAIWISAFIFGAIHMQFYGLVPRMLLGALFGYLYWYSGRLILAMFAHFVNNAISLILAYAYHQGAFETNPNSTESVPQWPIIVTFLVVGVFLFVLFKKYYSKNGNLARRI